VQLDVGDRDVSADRVARAIRMVGGCCFCGAECCGGDAFRVGGLESGGECSDGGSASGDDVVVQRDHGCVSRLVFRVVLVGGDGDSSGVVDFDWIGDVVFCEGLHGVG